MATKKIPCIYFQNSGLSNAINPLVSVAHKNVYSIPLLLIIGWRGSPNKKKDEPQHNTKGKITRKLLNLLGIKHIVLKNPKDLQSLEIFKVLEWNVGDLIYWDRTLIHASDNFLKNDIESKTFIAFFSSKTNREV